MEKLLSPFHGNYISPSSKRFHDIIKISDGTYLVNIETTDAPDHKNSRHHTVHKVETPKAAIMLVKARDPDAKRPRF